MNNIPEYSVTQLNQEIKNTLEKAYEYVSVKGESGSITVAKSGHVYFSIKEDDEVLSCICWKGNFEKLEIKIEEGVEYNFIGRITTFAKFGRSGYQLIIDQIEYSGEGSILKLIEERKKYFEELGYFNLNKKKPIPKYPSSIIVITSPTGSVIRDIIQRISERYPLAKLFICPITVQGKNTHREIIEYLDLLSLKNFSIKPSLVIFARGGGSLEEMMPFNEKELIERVFNFNFPTISAIGHETDYTLLDYVCDLRAPTPSAAAEICTPHQKELFKLLKDNSNNISKYISIILKDYIYRLALFKNTTSISIKKIFSWQRKIDFLINNQINIYKNTIEFKRDKIQLSFITINQNNPLQNIKEQTKYVKSFKKLLKKIIYLNITNLYERILFQDRLIKNSSIDKNLKRGYSLIFQGKKLIKTKKELSLINKFKIRLIDGESPIEKK